MTMGVFLVFVNVVSLRNNMYLLSLHQYRRDADVGEYGSLYQNEQVYLKRDVCHSRLVSNEESSW